MPYHFNNQLQGLIILLVDDEPDSLEVASRWLRLAGASVLTASDGKLGLEIALKDEPDLILADLSMSVMDGWRMLVELKNNPAIAQIPIVALTAHTLLNIREQALSAGFAAHIAKPFEATRLVTEVLQIMQSASSAQSGRVEDTENDQQ